MRQIAFRDFRLQGSKALGKLRPGEAVVLAGREGPAYFLIPVEPASMETQEEELKTALALSAMRESWRQAEVAGMADLSMEEINSEIAAYRQERKAPTIGEANRTESAKPIAAPKGRGPKARVKKRAAS